MIMQNFNYHQHTYRCGHADLDMLDEEYVIEYIKMGFKKIAFTDHCPEKNEIDTREDMRMKYSQREEYLTSIQKLKEKYQDKIEIETGYEIEYLPGEEKNLEELKQEVDKIILGQHFIYDNDKKLKPLSTDVTFTEEDLITYAKFIDKAMELKLPEIVAHPDFFMRSRKIFGKVEEKIAHKICQLAEKYNIPLEINLNNIFNTTYYENQQYNHDTMEQQKKKLKNVIYPCKGFWEIASNYDIKVLYGMDVHHRGQILLWNELREFANQIIGEETIKKLNFIKNSGKESSSR